MWYNMYVVQGIPLPSHLRYSGQHDRYTAGTPAIIVSTKNHYVLRDKTSFNANEDLL